MKRIFTLFLALALLIGATACGSETPSDTKPDNTTSAVTEEATDNTPAIFKKGLNFNGDTVTFLVRSGNVDEIYASAETGDIVNDAIYKSRVAVEDKLNLKFNFVERVGTSPQERSEYADHLAQTVMAGDDTYDWAEMMAAVYPSVIKKGILKDLSDAEHLEFDSPWWGGDLKKQATIGNGLYFLVGDYSTGYLSDVFCIYFNKQLFENYKLEDPYELVRSGNWTLDKLIEMSEAGSQDLNGDGKYDYEDSLGFVVHDQYHLCGFMKSNEVDAFTSNGSGFDYSFGTEHDFDVVTKMNQLLFKTDGGFLFEGAKTIASDLEDYNRLTSKFTSGEILMISAQMKDAVTDLRDMKQDYGILPFPKYDKNQENYYSVSRTTHSAISMPVTCSDDEKALAALEALAASNHDIVIPTYYETALKTKYSRDDESSEMYDIVLNSLSLSFGYLYNSSTVTDGNFYSPVEIFLAGVKNPSTFSSNCASRKSAAISCYTAFVDSIIEANK